MLKSVIIFPGADSEGMKHQYVKVSITYPLVLDSKLLGVKNKMPTTEKE
jgi:hypothetical protein